ncbi:hypothetical protein CHS0354_031918 [Potamilus streckersoni]|uniref:Fibronectin type-III domain-containing protein n=1 Tax=Potamilus streckersoni TaxID=2493646 RepID=A0AAE0RXY5_9BIVA|nr:hypothetical protein CHS0354_031918 [Potamilus streckersoni]
MLWSVQGVHNAMVNSRGPLGNVALANGLPARLVFKRQIEWELFDFHSGIHNVSWRLFDNFTKKDFLHGREAVPPQGEAETLAACGAKYGSYARGSNCYCTPFDGCYHKHFQVKPDIKDNGEGLIAGRDMGVHEYDYFIEITTYNRALLKTVLSFKLTIDTSPPHIGVVHDGIAGSPEVDFQQSLTLNAFWEGFFDKESGIMFYRYMFAETCVGKEYFVLESPLRSQTFETTTTYATFTAPKEGKYYITVAAYNHALEHSDPVCSDGVVIDTFSPSVIEVEVTGARAMPGLVKDNQGNIWVLSRDRFIRKVFRPTQACRDKANRLSFLADLPKQRHPNDTIVDEYNDTVCDRYSGAPNSLGGVLPSTHAAVGPILVDTTAPDFSGSIDIHLSGNYLVATWPARAFIDSEDMLFPLKFEFAVGEISHPTSVMNYRPLSSGGGCTLTSSPTCTAISLDSLEWQLHGHHVYYVAIKVTNTAGESTIAYSSPYIHDVQLPSLGKVLEVDPETHDSSMPTPLMVVEYDSIECYLTVSSTRVLFYRVLPLVLDYYSSVLPHIPRYWRIILESVYLISPGFRVLFYSATSHSQDLQDIDFQVNRVKIAATWSGFYHPHLEISFSIALGTTPKGTDVRGFQLVNGTTATFEGLNLIVYQKYYVSIKASSSAGTVMVSSDGVMVVQVGANFGAIIIKDGVPCNGTGLSSKMFSHHTDDQRIPCQMDIDYQSSANSLHAYWTVPDNMKPYTTLVYWSVEIRAPHLDVWDSFTEYEELANVHETRTAQMILESGHMYRSKVKFCASHFCGQPVVSDGVMVITDPPVSRTMSLTYTADGQITVILEKFYDPDIQNAQEARAAMDHYEWALTDNSHAAKILSVWERIQDSAIHALNDTHISFIIHLSKPLDFSECRLLSIRGYNKVGMWSAVSKDIKDCSQIDPLWIQPKIVIDVVPQKPMTTAGGVVLDDFGQADDNLIPQNGIWAVQDQDYTPYKNILSAVWPTLRHRVYDWAIIEWNVDEQITHLARTGLILENPCGHPNAITCGRTDKEYVNVYLNENNYLVDGRRYVICIHANKTAITKERWIQYLEAVSACSDGVTVDIAPPTPGKVWIGTEDTQMYQASLSDLMVHWESFVDLEVYGINIHPTTVQKYEVAIGSSYGGMDIIDFRNVGITNHATFHDLLLISGHTYYATVRATDFVNRTMTVTSRGVKIDVTSPGKSNLPITVSGKFITSTSEVGACWNGVFYEVESEIDYYLWAVGSEPGVDDAMTYTLSRDTCADSDTNNPVSLREGYPYFISVRAFNNLGLSSLATSWAYIVEASPPIVGHVYDGNSSLADQLGVKDLDFQTNLKNLTVRWEGFYDPHSAITSYYISVGRCPQCEDIMTEQMIGIKSEVTLHHLPLVSGLTYYASITACNGADMCTTVTSDGITLDNSPPIPGTVLDGVRGTDIYYQASDIYLAAEWFGYSDPQSGLDRYTYRVGTSPGGSDIIPETNLHLAEEVIITDVQRRNVSKLPLQTLIYTTVRVYNKAGLYAEASSNGFMVDSTPPVFTKEATLGPIGSMLLNTLITRTTLMVEWGVYDDESFIDRQYVSIESHVGGDFNHSSIPLNGIVRDYIFTDLDLNDGSRYYVTVWCCNGAGLCTKSTTPSILMDSTPPSMGMFAINTDHAADQRRQSPGWMTWEVFTLNLAWLGFADVHSGIDYYNVTVGSTYMGRDLNKVPGEATTLYHVSSTSIVKSEGAVQTFSFEIAPVVSHELIYIAVWAVNTVGMSSPVLHQAFRLVFGGVMELVRRCSGISCVGHCVCAPEDEVCSNPRPCTDKSATKKTEIKVMDVRNLRFENNEENVTYVATDTVLAATWRLNGANVEKPMWYEWSVGYEYASDPQGIFDVLSDRVWHDVGQRTSVVFSITRGKKLSYGMKYSVFVRAWYANGIYAVFKSPGVIIDTAPPKTTSIQGAAVRDKLTLNQTKDIDFIKKKMTLYAEWENKFLYTTDKVSYFKIYVSTSPGGHDIHYIDENLPPLANSYFISFMNWKPYTKYYSNVIAYSYAGRHRTETSDGFQLDTEPPNPGVVFDGIGLHDLEYQNNSRIISAHWHGFTDKGSGIARYYVCVTDIDTNPYNFGNCTLTDWRNNGIKTQVTFDLKETLENAQLYSLSMNLYFISSVITTLQVASSSSHTLNFKQAHSQTPHFSTQSDQAVSQALDFSTQSDHAVSQALDFSTQSDHAVSQALEFSTQSDHAVSQALDFSTQSDHAVSQALDFSTQSDHAVSQALDFSTQSDHAVSQALHFSTQSDHAVQQALHFSTQSDHAVSQALDFSTQSDHTVSQALDFSTQSDHAVSQALHLSTQSDHAVSQALDFSTQSDHTVSQALHFSTQSDHAVSQALHFSTQSDHAVSQALDFSTQSDHTVSQALDFSTQSDHAVSQALEFSTQSNNAVSQALHFSTQSNHALSQPLHFSTQSDHAVSQALHFSTQSDHAVQQALHFSTQSDHAVSQALDFSTQSDHTVSQALDFSTQSDHAVSQALHLSTQSDHAVSQALDFSTQSDHTVSQALHFSTQSDHAVSQALHFSTQSDHAVSQALDFSTQSDHTVSQALDFSTQSDHAVSQALHFSTLSDHAVSQALDFSTQSDHTVSQALHFSTQSDHAVSQALHFSTQSDHAVSQALDFSTQSDHTVSQALDFSTQSDHAVSQALHFSTLSDHAVSQALHFST